MNFAIAPKESFVKVNNTTYVNIKDIISFRIFSFEYIYVASDKVKELFSSAEDIDKLIEDTDKLVAEQKYFISALISKYNKWYTSNKEDLKNSIESEIKNCNILNDSSFTYRIYRDILKGPLDSFIMLTSYNAAIYRMQFKINTKMYMDCGYHHVSIDKKVYAPYISRKYTLHIYCKNNADYTIRDLMFDSEKDVENYFKNNFKIIGPVKK